MSFRADAIGLNFYPQSPRYVDIETAQQLSLASSEVDPDCQRVGLFVNPTASEVNAVIAQVTLDMLQFSGEESAEFCRSFDLPYLKAVKMQQGTQIESYEIEYADAWALLLDAHDPNQAGGTGQVFDWGLWPQSSTKRLILAGGLGPENVAAAVRQLSHRLVSMSAVVSKAITKGLKTASACAALYRKQKMAEATDGSNYAQPTDDGHFGDYGGRFVAETLTHALDGLARLYNEVKDDPDFKRELHTDLAHFVGRPTPLYFAERLTETLGGAAVYLKREDLNHTGAHKVCNTIGQALLAKRMGKPRVIAETGAGQHGVATATVAARLGLQCDVYMGAEDVQRQSLNVYRMKLMGANVIPVTSGSKTLKDAMNEAMRDWVTNVDDTHYIIGTVAGPHPYPMIVRDFAATIGQEARAQMLEQVGRLPDVVVACVGGGSNAMGIFYPFIDDVDVALVGVEAGGHGIASGAHAAPLNDGKVGVLHGNRSYLMSDEDGQIKETHSISAGLDYPGVGPEHAHLKDIGRATYASATDDEAMAAFRLLNSREGILPALETSHALAWVSANAPSMSKEQSIRST